MVADVYRTHGDLKEAEQHWLRAIFHDPADIAAREALVGLYKRQRRTHDAIDVLVRLQKLDPQNALYPLEAGVLYVELQEFDAAEEAFERVLAVAPHDSRGYEATFASLSQRPQPSQSVDARTEGGSHESDRCQLCVPGYGVREKRRSCWGYRSDGTGHPAGTSQPAVPENA